MTTPKWIEEEMAEFQIAYEQGERLILFEAIRACAQYGIPLPEWIYLELQIGLDRYKSAEAWEFGEAFGITRAKGAKQPAERSKRTKAWSVYCAVVEAQRGNHVYPSESVRTAIGREFGISASTVGNYFKEVRDYLQAYPTD